MRVVIADDHPIFLHGLNELLKQTGTVNVVGMARDGAEAVRLVAEFVPDIALLDVRMPVMSGIEALASIRKSSPDVGVLLFSGYLEAQDIYESIELGAKGYLLKTSLFEEVFKALNAVYCKSNVALDPEVQAQLANGIRQHTNEFLTGRQAEILKLLSEGQSSMSIARELNISLATVKHHLSNLYSKLGVARRDQAIIEALKRGLI